jgi:hypothetical protein
MPTPQLIILNANRFCANPSQGNIHNIGHAFGLILKSLRSLVVENDSTDVYDFLRFGAKNHARPNKSPVCDEGAKRTMSSELYYVHLHKTYWR